MSTYITQQGDTWDGVAYKACGSEYYAGALMKMNARHLHYHIFPAGITLELPETAAVSDAGLPPWKRVSE